MKVFKATMLLIYEDARWFFGRLVVFYITIPLFLFWLILGTSFNLDVTGTISGPMYFFIPLFGAVGYKELLRIGIGLGSTRTVILKSFYFVSVLSIIFTTTIINLLYFVLATLYQNDTSSANIQHFGRIIEKNYDFTIYLWTDLMICIFIFGLTFLFTCITYRVGMVKMLISSFIIPLLATSLYYIGLLDIPLQRISELNVKTLQFITGIGVIGIISLVATYPLMRNASMQKKTTRFEF